MGVAKILTNVVLGIEIKNNQRLSSLEYMFRFQNVISFGSKAQFVAKCLSINIMQCVRQHLSLKECRCVKVFTHWLNVTIIIYIIFVAQMVQVMDKLYRCDVSVNFMVCDWHWRILKGEIHHQRLYATKWRLFTSIKVGQVNKKNKIKITKYLASPVIGKFN